jgi:hypothetical protein
VGRSNEATIKNRSRKKAFSKEIAMPRFGGGRVEIDDEIFGRG